MLRRFKCDENGAFAIDAIFGITFFMLSMIALLFMSLIIRIQSNVQYAIGQTAKEVSGYYYLIDKLGLAGATSGASNQATDVDGVINNVMSFSGSLEETANNVVNNGIGTDFNKIKDDLSNHKAEMEELKKSIESLDGNSAAQIMSVFSKTAANGAVNYFIAPFVTKQLIFKYLAPSGQYSNLNEYYGAVGMENVNFQGSQFLTDQRSIKIQITYELDLKKYTLGFVDYKIKFRQVASTAAWVRPSGANIISLEQLSEDLKP